MPSDFPLALLEGIQRDLRGEWIPDAIGGADAFAAMARGVFRDCADYAIEPIRVPLASRSDSVWNVDVRLRVHLHLAVDAAISTAELELSPYVFGHRGPSSDYAPEYRRRLATARSLAQAAETAYVVLIDLHRFSRSVTMDLVRTQPWCTPRLIALLGDLCNVTSQVVIHGHEWAGRIANLVLAPLDAIISQPFVRWGDDYHVFASSQREQHSC
jgi:hypothetical protein